MTPGNKSLKDTPFLFKVHSIWSSHRHCSVSKADRQFELSYGYTDGRESDTYLPTYLPNSMEQSPS